ncbi:hypothetical protein EC957_003980 [Mortierella hygrophila]|uniref:LIM zinc-binding domain-containing protein n=1 Tax=Mortierella hygrophila TaxID=979708 RepID=A0A9P6F2G3_9FUNG|nr:hypothetical protein EC957_003980 [Mortierella hygrophila]
MPPRFVTPAAPKCPRCTKSVYSAEQIIGPNGAAWHKACFTCRECNRRLDSNILAEHEGEAFCKTCHKKMWGPTGYGYGSGLLVREDPESQFKQSIGRPPNSTGSQNNDNDNTNTNSGSYATLDEVVYNNTGGSNRSAGRGHNESNNNSGETEEERRERLTPVNASLKKRNSLEMIRDQAEASRRAYDEAHNQRIANKYGKVTANSTGGSTASAGSRSDLHLGGGSSHLHAQSGYISAGSDTSSAFGSTKATTSSPAPSFSSISSTTSSQPATKSLFLNQSYRTTSSTSTASYQDPESDYAKSRQALNFQTGAPAPVSSGPPSLPKRAPEPVMESIREPTPIQQHQVEQRAADDDFEDYMPIRVVARKEEPAPIPAPTATSAVEEDEWDAAPAQKQPEQPIYRSQYLRQQDKREHEQREQAQREQEYLDRARAASSAVPAQVSSSSASSVTSTPTSSARLNRLINETDKLTLNDQEQRHAQPASSAAAGNNVDEWDEDPTPTMPSKPQNLSYSAARNVSPAAARTWTPTANTTSETTSQPNSTNHSRISSAELNNPTATSPVSSQTTLTPKTSYYRSGGLMTPKKMTTSFGGGGDICPRCQKTVYHAESALAPGGAKYHKLCLRCVECSKSLDSTNMTDRQGTPYCKTCYSKAWGAKGYGYNSGASGLHTEL